jgi:RNA polymerase sigma-70 factor (ECF subfamily)
VALSDEKLIEACKKGEPEAQEELYRRFSPMLFGVCLRYARDRMEAQDYLQEGFIAIYRDLYQFRPKGALGAWLRKVMVNACLQQIRKRKPFQDMSLEDFSGKLESDAEVYGQLEAKELIRLLQKLPEGYRAVFNLYVIEGYSHQEIAERLGISLSTSKSQLSRAKTTLRRMLEQVI